ncbi:MAG: indole-3-glycerol phosphate synthase TrpC [Armatimonadota bacterium]|nr:MAG: indole-3-glycerol phosphate synthase TrpC [Armatimonadota bacterium]
MLETILAHKREEIAPLRVRHQGWRPPHKPARRRSFAGALRRPGISVIAEFKRRSPSRGNIRLGADPAGIARIYERAGAAAMSVLTDVRFFGGRLDDLRRARGAVGLPVLRKDFVIEPCQIAESADIEGPDCLLLIAAAVTAEELQSLRELAAQCGQAALVEVHNEEELARALESGAEILGINNRDLKTLEVSLETTLKLKPLVPDEIPVVSESGIHTADDMRRLADAGVDAVLIGEALMATQDPARKLEELLSAI